MRTFKYLITRIRILRLKLVLILIALLCCFDLYSQEKAKKDITTADYSKWGKLTGQTISENGNWVYYVMRYDDVPDTLFVSSTSLKNKYTFPTLNRGDFIAEKTFVCLDKNQSLNLLDLTNGKILKIEKVKSYAVSGHSQRIVTTEQEDGKNYLRIRDLTGKLLQQFDGLVQFKMNNARNALLGIFQKDQLTSAVVIKLDVLTSALLISKGSQETYSNLTWSESNESLALSVQFKNDPLRQRIYHYSLQGNKLNELDPNNNDSFSESFQKNAKLGEITISPDDKRLIFGMRDLSVANDDSVQIWNGNDPLVYSEKKHIGELDIRFRAVVWWLADGRILNINEIDKKAFILNNSKDYALIYSYNEGFPQYTEERKVNYHVKNLETGELEFLIKDQSLGLGSSSMSPQGTYFAYFNDNSWWLYNFRKKIVLKLPNLKDSNWTTINDRNQVSSGDIAGWDVDEKFLIIHDSYDVWKLTLDGQILQRLTKGRENEIAFKVIVDQRYRFFPYSGINHPTIDLNKEVLLSAKGKNETGFYVLKPNSQVHKISYGNFYASAYLNLSKALKGDSYLFQSETNDTPSQLKYVDLPSQNSKILFQSNAHYVNYHWSKQEIITYRNSKNEELTGLLYYPTNYDASRKYPMLVFIYEDQNYRRHYYNNPSRYNLTGFNISSLTTQGYFVLMPDITYEIGNTGISATDCVLAATNKVIAKNIVNKERIALMGQSFGGYETNFILTQTGLFRAAISGVSIFDLESMYLSISISHRNPEIWRFESQQWRMGKSLYDDRIGYERNSPSTYVDKITTPLLIWVGEKDTQINPNQSIALYLALRRLGKKNIMLMYPKESHSILLKQNQIDLYNRINDWLAYYLKDEIPSEWISNGIK